MMFRDILELGVLFRCVNFGNARHEMTTAAWAGLHGGLDIVDLLYKHYYRVHPELPLLPSFTEDDESRHVNPS